MAIVPVGAYAETFPRKMHEATIYCEQNLDAREADATGKHFFGVKACALQIMHGRTKK